MPGAAAGGEKQWESKVRAPGESVELRGWIKHWAGDSWGFMEEDDDDDDLWTALPVQLGAVYNINTLIC